MTEEEPDSVAALRGGRVQKYTVGENIQFSPAPGQRPRIGRIAGFLWRGSGPNWLVYADITFQNRHYQKYLGIEAINKTEESNG